VAFDYGAMMASFKEVMADAWTDTNPSNDGGGVWEISEVARRSFEEIGGFPYGVIELPTTDDADWGLSNDAQEANLSLHYVAMEEATMATLGGKLEAIKDAFFDATITGVTVLYRTAFDVNAQHPANAIFLSKKVPYSAGSIVMRIVYGENLL
jgi:hypothetical protein